MKCEDCNNEAKYFINFPFIPQCERCMIESLCSVPTEVISIEAYEEISLKGVNTDGQYPKAS